MSIQPPHIPHFAPEVIDDILCYLSKDRSYRRTLCDSALVCRVWAPLAQAYIYDSITLSEEPHVSSLYDTLSQFPHLASFVRHLTIRKLNPEIRHLSTVFNLPVLCPDDSVPLVLGLIIPQFKNLLTLTLRRFAHTFGARDLQWHITRLASRNAENLREISVQQFQKISLKGVFGALEGSRVKTVYLREGQYVPKNDDYESALRFEYSVAATLNCPVEHIVLQDMDGLAQPFAAWLKGTKRAGQLGSLERLTFVDHFPGDGLVYAVNAAVACAGLKRLDLVWRVPILPSLREMPVNGGPAPRR